MLWSCTMQPMLISHITNASMALEEAYNNLAMFAFDVVEEEETESSVEEETESSEEEEEEEEESSEEEEVVDEVASIILDEEKEEPVNLNVDNGNCSYNNTTTVPMVLSFVVGTITGQKQVAPQDVSYQPYPTTPELLVTAHANLSPIARNYTNNNSYEILTDNGKLNLVASAQDGKTISNKTLWRILINATSADGDDINIQLAPGQSKSFPDSVMFVMIIPLIEDKVATPTPTAQQCVINNDKSAISLQFS